MWDTTGRRPGHDRVFGVPVREAEEWRWIVRLGGAMWIVGGFNLLAVFTALGAPARHLPPLIAAEGALMVVGIVHFALDYALTDDQIRRWVVPLVLWSVYVGAGAIPLVMWLSDPPAYTFGWASAVGVLLLSAYAAGPVHGGVALTVIAAGNGVLILQEPERYASALGQFLWVLATLAAVLWIISGMVGRLDRMRREAETARGDLADLNADLTREVNRQVTELERLGQLRRFLSAPVADALLADDDRGVLDAHRREIAVLFCDLRGFTAFTRSVEPEEVIAVLDAYYQAVGERFDAHHATIGAYEGDGVMAFLNDPFRVEDPGHRVLDLALEVGKVMDGLTAEWQSRDYDLGYGIGVAMGHATLGLVGFEGRTDYTALGNVVNLAARLCAQAGRGQIVVDRRVHLEVRADVDLLALPPLSLKGFSEPVPVFELPRTTG